MGRIKQLAFSLTVLGVCVLTSHTTRASDFKVYWNVPTFMCRNFGVNINVTKFGIIQNTGDVFQGDKVNIWYQPGKFPRLEGNESVNGGIPQNGNLELHVSTFTDQVETMPADFDGVAILDFEYYLPSYAWASKEYREASRDWVSSQHPEWSAEDVEAESERSFNSSIRDFMEVVLDIGADLRPNALWGYYHYPYCKNYGGVVECGNAISEMNDNTLWIYEASKAMYPSIYLLQSVGVDGRRNMTLGRILESQRLNEMLIKPTAIFTYCWYRYHEVVEFITPEDIMNTIGLSKERKVDGSVIWGGSYDLDTEEKCLQFQEYVDNVFGPLVKFILEMPETLLGLALKSPGLMAEVISFATEKNTQ